MTIRTAYQQAVERHGLQADDGQLAVVEQLASLQQRLAERQPSGNWFSRLVGRAPAAQRGIYLWGGVGRGKTFLMDLFFSTLDVDRKKRIHFHRMMRDVHDRLNAISDVEDPLAIVAADIAAETRVLCFDEFYVSDIGDAMILGRLLDGLFERGVTLVATSNAHPRDLYRDGLQRSRFIPAIEALEAHTEVIELDGGIDYRLRMFEKAGTYFVPGGADADEKLGDYFDRISSGSVGEHESIDVLGRPVRARRYAKGIAWFEFDAICGGPRSQDDYIELARWYPTVIVSNVPFLTRKNENAARRFVALVDEFYDRKVKLVISAAAAADSLYQGKLLAFEFQRTTSRLIEMQAAEYLHAPHLA